MLIICCALPVLSPSPIFTPCPLGSLFDLQLSFTLCVLGQNTGKKVSQGHKASFCLEDTKCDPGFERVWNCTDMGDQGISPGCYDIYYYNIDCQWVDCTDFVHGSFYLRVHINPGNQVAESDFKNNVAKCSVYDYGGYVIANRCWIGESDNKYQHCD